jgi:hypothetical protein
MNQETSLTLARLKTPRAAAIASIIFSVLLMTSLALIRLAVPADPRETGAWLTGNFGMVALALNLMPFAGIAFLWFIGVVRDRLGEHEDRFFLYARSSHRYYPPLDGFTGLCFGRNALVEHRLDKLDCSGLSIMDSVGKPLYSH